MDKVIEVREKKKAKAQQQYEAEYLKVTRGFQKQEGELYKEVFDEMFNNFNEVVTGNPLVDARMNWANAKASVFQKKLSGNADKKKLNLKGDKTPVSTNLSVDSKIDESPAPEIHLDEFAADFVKRTKMKDASVKEALKGDVGAHLSSRR